ncbi:MAG: hypothetical protein HWE20_14780 [Gammaproteobacteria bacterium]|nr:hypothetical protein [Gammaproteobacteria bacterium]
MMDYCVCIDGGGTKCRATVFDATGNPLGSGLSGSANAMLGVDAVMSSIQDASTQAIADANLSISLSQCAAGIGLAGYVGAKHHRDQLHAALDQMFAAYAANSDAHIACMGAHFGRDGSILILGTGSCAYNLSDGAGVSLGGWGAQISDHGSGFSLGIEAVKAACFAADHLSDQTPMTRAIQEELGDRAEDIFHWSISAKPRDYARYAPTVFRFADQDDPLAKNILQTQLGYVTQIIDKLNQRFQTPVALVGGLASSYLHRLDDRIRTMTVEPSCDPLVGAYLMWEQQRRNR